MAASLTVGLGCISPRPRQVVVVAPVDTLPARHSTLRALLTAVMADGIRVATPRYRGRGGHPVVAHETLLQVFRHGYSGTLRDLIRGADAQRRRLDVNDAAVGSDLDTPADLAALRPGLVPYFAANGTTWSDAGASTNISE